ncbi:hypothetical protein B0H14DRAFT_2574650 [Mycena olivaceomarginata]|nr:hypothetical protein B0H14DRAFT_2574650 [Mycena olivaceomarginata]
MAAVPASLESSIPPLFVLTQLINTASTDWNLDTVCLQTPRPCHIRGTDRDQSVPDFVVEKLKIFVWMNARTIRNSALCWWSRWKSLQGLRKEVHARLPGSFFGLGDDVEIACRQASPECGGGVSACESLDPFLEEERRELDLEPSRKLAAEMLRTREMQDNTEVGQTLAYDFLNSIMFRSSHSAVRFHRSLEGWRCNGIRTDGAWCNGTVSSRKLNAPERGKHHILLCSKRSDTLASGSLHSQAQILDDINEEPRRCDLKMRPMTSIYMVIRMRYFSLVLVSGQR